MPRKPTPSPEARTDEEADPVEGRTRERQRLLEDLAWLLERWLTRRSRTAESGRPPGG
jgi:hypothetical protein